MKSIFAVLVLAPSLALACMPSGERLDKSEKAAFAKDLAMSNPQCARVIAKQIGSLKADDTYVFEDASDNLVRYTISGKMRMSIHKVKIMGKIRYECSKPTGLTRGC